MVNGYRKALAAGLAVFLCLALAAVTHGLTVSPESGGAPAAQPLGDLAVGDRVVDNSWIWEHKTGNAYTGEGKTGAVTWIVVAGDHYEGLGSHVTLMAEEIIGCYPFDNSTDRGSSQGSNHWGESGAADATMGLRPWLNETFFESFSPVFQEAALVTPVPNELWDGIEGYVTEDRVFIPSQAELGGADAPVVGQVYEYFQGPGNTDANRAAELGGVGWYYWTRTPSVDGAGLVLDVQSDGQLGLFAEADGESHGVRPVVNLDSDTEVSLTVNHEGAYEIIAPTRALGTLAVGELVRDPTWEWEHRTGGGYTGDGDVGAVTWIVAARDHYPALGSHATLLAQDLIARHPYDNSTDRGSPSGSSHWGQSGTTDATRGLRPFLNSLDAGTYGYAGEGFLAAFSAGFREALLETELPNLAFGEVVPYYTSDKVFVPSHTELGIASEPAVGTVLEYFDGAGNTDANRIAVLDGSAAAYWTRSPSFFGPSFVDLISESGGVEFPSDASYSHGGVRPAVNLDPGVQLFAQPDGQGVYEFTYATLTVDIEPAGARGEGASWSIDGGESWHQGGSEVKTAPGVYDITFRELDGWDTPPDIEGIDLSPGDAASETGIYVRQQGTLRVDITPEGAVNDGARWSIDNGVTWHESGVELPLDAGDYTVSFKNIENWIPPAQIPDVTITRDSDVVETGAYVEGGVLRVVIEPSRARAAGARWSVDGGTTWFVSGSRDLPAGTYDITFRDLAHWDKPAVIPGVQVNQGQTTHESGEYDRHMGRLTVTIEPESARSEGAEWSIDGGNTWHQSGAELDLETGDYTVTFQALPGWLLPGAVSRSVTKDATTSYNATYGDVLYGDVNGDEQVNLFDVIMVLQYIVDTISFDHNQLQAGDVDGSGSVDVTDAVYIMQYILGLIDMFPAAEG